VGAFFSYVFVRYYARRNCSVRSTQPT
jgi:hypothetical protein